MLGDGIYNVFGDGVLVDDEIPIITSPSATMQQWNHVTTAKCAKYQKTSNWYDILNKTSGA